MIGKALLVAAALPAALQAAPALTFVPAGKRFLPGVNGKGTPGHVALTFDDGPDGRSTPLIVEALQDLDVRATFFVLGENCERFPDVTRQLVDHGHEVAVHSWDHRNHLRRLSTRDQLSRTVDLVEAQTGTRPRFFRPPYGALTAADLLAARSLGLRTVLWTSWGRDWRKGLTGREVVDEVLKGDVDGGTVLLHDSDCTSAPGSWLATLRGLPLLVEELHERGLKVGPLGEHGLV